MKVDKRHNMYGVLNANYCINMSLRDYTLLTNEDLEEEFGRQYCSNWCALMHRDDEVPIAKDWYLQNDGEVTTLYFPTEEMIEHCEQLLTLCRLKHK